MNIYFMDKKILLKWDIYIFFFHIKFFFSANNVYFVKKKNFFSKKKFFFNLFLQQMNDHIHLHLSKKKIWSSDYFEIA